MAKRSVVILQDSRESCLEISEAIASVENFSISGVSTDGEQGLEMISRLQPDFIIMGIILKTVDGFYVLEKLKSMGFKGKILVVSSFTSTASVERALASGVNYFLAKPFRQELLCKRLKELCEEEPLTIESKGYERKSVSLEEKISKIFISVGIPPHIKGYQYLREGVKMAVYEPEIINNITKQLYPRIGEKYSTTASKVERAIRHAIEVAWNRGRIETINSLLGIRAYVTGEKPTNGEFIALIADKMLLEGA